MNGKLPAHDILPLTHAIARVLILYSKVSLCRVVICRQHLTQMILCTYADSRPVSSMAFNFNVYLAFFPCYKARSRGCFLLVHTWLRASDILSDIRSQAPRGCLSGRAGICKSALNIIAATAIRVSKEFHIPSSEEEARHASPLVFV